MSTRRAGTRRTTRTGPAASTAYTIARISAVASGYPMQKCGPAPQLSRLLETLVATGRPWRVVARRPARRVLVPTYAELRVVLAESSNRPGIARPRA
jgi:hypothetical protein